MGDNSGAQTSSLNGNMSGEATSTQRRMSLTQRLIGNARDWFSGAKEPSRDFNALDNKYADQTGSDSAGGRSRSRSKSLGANVAPYSFHYETRELIIPGPVF